MKVSSTGTVVLEIMNTAPTAPDVERIDGPRPMGSWGYVVRSGGVALEVVVERRRSPYLELQVLAGQRTGPTDVIAMLDALLHVRVDPESEPTTGGCYQPSCELVGGACQSGGVFAVVRSLFDEHARKEGDGWVQPEAFWLALGRAIRGVEATP